MPRQSGPHSIDLEDWPSVLALPMQDFQGEQQPFLKLWLMCDVVELSLRLATVVGVGELLALHGELPAGLRAALHGQIDRPTTGQWKNIVGQIIGHLTKPTPIAGDLNALFQSEPHGLARLMDAPAGAERSLVNSLSALRNEGLAHGAGVSREQAKQWLDIWQPPFEAAMSQHGRMLSGWLLVCARHEGLAALRGPSSMPSPIELPDDVADQVRTELDATEDDAVVLVRQKTVRRAWPLTLYGKPRSGKGMDEDLDAEPAPQLYSRNDVVLQYTPIGSEELWRSVGSGSAAKAFVRLFSPPPPPIRRQVRGFEQDLHRDVASLVGRRQEIALIQRLLAGQTHGVLWMTGRAGIGKSFLMAKVALDPLPEPITKEEQGRHQEIRNRMLVLGYRFKIGDDRCSRERFCQFALERLREWPGLRPVADPKEDSEEARRRKALSLQLRETLQRIDCDNGCRVLLLLDGLDELLEIEQPTHRGDPKSVASFVRQLTIECGKLPGVLWLWRGGRNQH